MSWSSLILYNEHLFLLRFHIGESTDKTIERLSSKVSRCKLPLLMIFLSKHVFLSLLRFLSVQLRYTDVRPRFVVAVHPIAHVVETVVLPIDS